MNKQDIFLEKAYNKHSRKYDYSLAKYTGSRNKIKIICTEHGVFEQEPVNHLRGQGCPECKGVKRNTKDKFIKKAKEIHGDKYDYSLVEYKNNKTKVKIICPEHGVFEVRPDNHTNKKSGCPLCANNQLCTSEEFIQKSKEIHGDKYDYSLVDYETAHIKVKIICPEHGIFEQKPNSHLNGDGCSKCSNKYQYTTHEYIIKAKDIHGDKYDYSLVKYKNSNKKIEIICPKHGIFEQVAHSHLKGHGCPICYNELRRYDTEKFIKLSINKHNNKYDYSLVNYKHSNKKVKIICSKHGIFEQKPANHLKGNSCPMCKESKGEREISIILDKHHINYIRQHIYEDCKDERYLPFDFYLPEYNICVEYDGLQHFKSIEYFGGDKTLEMTKKHDKIKNEYCKNNNIRILRIRYNQDIKKELSIILNS